MDLQLIYNFYFLLIDFLYCDVCGIFVRRSRVSILKDYN